MIIKIILIIILIIIIIIIIIIITTYLSKAEFRFNSFAERLVSTTRT